MTDNDDYMVPKATGNVIMEIMWDRLQEGINANRRFRLRGIAGGDNMRYDTTKVVWDTDIYIYFTRESDGAWVYNKVNANPTTGITCDNDDLLYVTLNDTTATVLTMSVADYTSMPTDDTGRILILGSVRSGTWYGLYGGGLVDHAAAHHTGGGDLLSHDSIPGFGSNAHSAIDTHLASTANPHSVDWSDISSGHDASAHSSISVTDLSDVTGVGSGIIISTAERNGLHAESHDFDTHTGDVNLADLAAGSSGSIVIRGAADWEELVKSTDDKVLTLVSGYPAWADPPAADNLGDHTATENLQMGAWVITSNDADNTWQFGRCVIWSNTDNAYFSHRDKATTTQYAIRQLSTGFVDINAPTGTSIALAINAVDVVIVSATSVSIAQTLTLTGNSISGTGYIVGPNELGWLEDIYDTGVTSVEFDHLDGVTESIQTHMSAGNPHSSSASDTDLSTHASATATHGVAQVANHAEIASQISTHTSDDDAHHVKTVAFTDLTDDIVYTQIDSIVDIAGGGAVNLISRADHVHTAADGSSKVTYTDLLSIPSTFAPSDHDIITTHTDTGLTVGYVIRAATTSTFAWAQLAHSDLNDDESGQHFLQGDIITVGTVSTGDVSAVDSIGNVATKQSGDIFYWTTSLQRLGKGSDADVLTLASGVPSWAAPGAPGAHHTTHEPGGADIIDYLILDKTGAIDGVVNITPSGALSAGDQWIGVRMIGSALDPPVGSPATIIGMEIDLTGVLMTNDPSTYGIQVKLPTAYGSSDEMAAYFSGDNKIVHICDDTYALYVDAGNSLFDGVVYFGAGTTYYIDGSAVPKFNIAADDTTYTGIVTSDSGVLKYRTKSEILSDIGGIGSVVDDIAPQLGGDLDLNGKNIDFPTTPNISDVKDEDTMVTDSATMLATQQSIKAYVDAHAMIGVANACKIPCNMYTSNEPFKTGATTGGTALRNAGGTDFLFTVTLGIPMNRGGLKLYINNIYVGCSDADGGDYITAVGVYGMAHDSQTSLYTDGSNRTTPAEFYAGDGTWAAWGAATDCSGYVNVLIYIQVFATNASDLDINYIAINCYYDT